MSPRTMSPRASARRLAGVLVAAATALSGLAAFAPVASATSPAHRSGGSGCQLGNGIRHVVDIQFDNVHLTRDDPNVPSDLEQMPALYDFLKDNGVVMADDHDVLVHTATNFIANQTGLYPDRTAVTQSNSYNYFDSSGQTHSGGSFGYWTDPVSSIDTNYNMQYTANRADVPNASNVNVPAPWVPFTRAGCNVGAVGMANEMLENTGSDITTVFGANSPQAAEAKADPTKAQADYVGFGIHCARTSTLCATGENDVLPDEPGGYHGYQALFGNAQIQPVISPSGPVKALNGSPIADSSGNPGFPGFDSETPTNSLGYAAQMLEHGVQDVNVYISDAHGAHPPFSGNDLGPGSQTYEQQLAAYNTGFERFLARLHKDNITPQNTEFVVTTDEGDHFSGSVPTPAGCTGLHGNYCNYTTRSEVNVNLDGLLRLTDNNTTPFAIHSDPAPALSVQGRPARTDPKVRQLERNIGRLTITNPLTGARDKVAYQMADPVEEKILHFVSSDPARTPTMTLFSGEDEYIGSGSCNSPADCVYTVNGYAWNHGGSWPDMQDIWSAYVGPGISARGVDDSVWTDQTDMRPTLMALTGLRDDYPVDGRVLVEIAAPNALPRSLRAHYQAVVELGQVYKQILGSTGQFAEDTLAMSTRGLESGNAGHDLRYAITEAALNRLDARRDRIAGQISSQLLGAAFHGTPVNQRRASSLVTQAKLLLALTP
ncbi:hypothetical protein [Leekyejoonella antrihumi]|uniref:Phosphoesterase n=1 Tax=Leekyejoonella antrihumi TaxID=1660198 RepID=A0A563DTU2_9MICO|nr:hypothetical protein [Leekyejoonella antrihumi]TWP33609.1 hypothetical protein FGL98_20490 [Leekyejoonella antrihumi]